MEVKRRESEDRSQKKEEGRANGQKIKKSVSYNAYWIAS